MVMAAMKTVVKTVDVVLVKPMVPLVLLMKTMMVMAVAVIVTMLIVQEMLVRRL